VSVSLDGLMDGLLEGHDGLFNLCYDENWPFSSLPSFFSFSRVLCCKTSGKVHLVLYWSFTGDTWPRISSSFYPTVSLAYLDYRLELDRMKLQFNASM